MKDIYEAITQQMVSMLEAGTVPWRQTWNVLPAANYITQKPYQGINALLLNTTRYGCPFWVSFKQARDLGGKVKKGERSMPVVFYRFLERKDDLGQPVYDEKGRRERIPLLRYSNVFNLQQTEGIAIPELNPAVEADSCQQAQRIVNEFKLCPIVPGRNPVYSPVADEIRMPSPTTFQSQEEYYHTLFHEMGHATGHPSRLARPGMIPGNIQFGSKPYSREELIAEMTACFLSNEAGILNKVVFENSAGYVASWLKELKDDHRLVLSAASQAQRASNMIRNISLDVSEEMEVPLSESPQEQGISAVISPASPHHLQNAAKASRRISH